MGAHVTDSIPNQSCCNVPPLCLHLGVKTWPTVASWATTQHLFGNNKQKRHIFLSFPPSQVQYINTLKSIFVEIQKYYGQLSRWFYAKLLENIKAPEGKQTLRRHDMLIIRVLWKVPSCFSEAPEPTDDHSFHFTSLHLHTQKAKHCNISWSWR